jgi:hypothetical protein
MKRQLLSSSAIATCLVALLAVPPLERAHAQQDLAPRKTPSAPQPPAASAPAIPTELALKQVVQSNLYAFIPAQCYTKTIDAGGKAHNPCYTCHVASRAPNFVDDGDLQLGYDFVSGARTNRWSNLFVDWSQVAPVIGTDEILTYVRQSNYFDERGEIRLARQLASPPRAWDFKDDGRWSGYIPDARFHFDDAGFDRLAGGGYSGWRSYAYYPLPGTFWPTNGSMGDALIRLPQAFRETEASGFDRQTYELNLAVVEALIRQADVWIEPVREAPLGVDLDLDGTLGVARRVSFGFGPSGTANMSFVGMARKEQRAGRVHLAAGLFPEGTEFLHTVRYLDPTSTGVKMAARLKELRYTRKAVWWAGERLNVRARLEAEEKIDHPAEIRGLGGDLERGIENGQGWWYQGFIEDAEGALRPQTFEETAYCVGCHGGVGRTDDGVFSFGRRLPQLTFQRGWFHWSQRGTEGVPDPSVHGGTGTEYVTYLEENGAADEFRQNDEVQRKFFDARGQLNPVMRERLRRDISEVLLPSRERALALDKAYRALVRTQRFSEGRDVVLGGARQVYRSVPSEQKTGVVRPVAPSWEPARTRPVATEPPAAALQP